MRWFILYFSLFISQSLIIAPFIYRFGMSGKKSHLVIMLGISFLSIIITETFQHICRLLGDNK